MERSGGFPISPVGTNTKNATIMEFFLFIKCGVQYIIYYRYFLLLNMLSDWLLFLIDYAI